MEPCKTSSVETGKQTTLGHCRHFFWLGVIFDTVGATVLFTGVLTDLLFYDLLLYMGSIIIIFSLLWWVFWYTGNIVLTQDEAMKTLYGLSSASVENAPSQTDRHRFFFPLRTFPITSGNPGQGRRRSRLLQRANSLLGMTLTDQIQKEGAKEDLDEGGRKSAKQSSAAEDFGREDLGLELKAVKSSKGVRAPGPDPGPLSPKAGRPSTHLVQPKFTPSPLPPSILASEGLPVVPLCSTSQSTAIFNSKSLRIASMASKGQPPVSLASTTPSAVPLFSTGQPLDTLSSEFHPAASDVSQSFSLVPMAWQNHLPGFVASDNTEATFQGLWSVPEQNHFQVHVDPESDFQNLSPSSQSQTLPVQADQAQGLASQVSLAQVLPAPSFENQPVDLQVTLCDTQLAPRSRALVQEIALSQSSHVQELSQEGSDTVSPPPAPLALAAKAQQSRPLEGLPDPTAENYHLL